MVKILLYKQKKHFWFDKIVHAVTGYWYYHTALWIGDVVYNSPFENQSTGTIYESAAYFDQNNKWHSGIRKYKSHPTGEVWRFKIPPTPEQEKRIKAFAESEIGEPYNFSKLIGMVFIYPLRWLWKLIGYVPFSWEFMGKICSVYVDACIIAGGIDLFPDRGEKDTVPGDFSKSPLLEIDK